MELRWHVELEVVAVAVAALEELDFGLSSLLDFAAVPELLFLVELRLERILHFVCMPWRVALRLMELDGLGFH